MRPVPRSGPNDDFDAGRKPRVRKNGPQQHADRIGVTAVQRVFKLRVAKYGKDFRAKPSINAPGVAEFVAVCDVKEKRRLAVKKIADEKYGNENCAMYRDFREVLDRSDIDAVLIATGPNWHATMAMNAARAGKDMYCEKPVTKNIAQSLILAETMQRTGRVFQAGTQRRNLPHFAFACELARTGKLGKLKKVFAHPAGMQAMMSGWLVPETEPDREVVDWDMYLGPAAWRPFNEKLLDGFNFEKGGGLVGGGVLEWGSHCVDLCQWA